MSIRRTFGVPTAGTISGEKVAQGDDLHALVVTCTSHTDGTFSCKLPTMSGVCLNGEVVNGAGGDQPTDGYTLVLTDVKTGRAFTFAGLSNAANNALELTPTNPVPGFFTGEVTLSLSGMGSGKSITLHLVTKA